MTLQQAVSEIASYPAKERGLILTVALNEVPTNESDDQLKTRLAYNAQLFSMMRKLGVWPPCSR